MPSPNENFVLADDTPRSSKKTINIAGFHVYLYGVDELTPGQARDTTVVFHIHGRTRTYKDAEDLAHQVLHELRQRPATRKGLVVATFDNRNHGERAGIVVDVQTVMTFLESYVEEWFVPTQFIISGMSLGGHISWDLLARDPRVQAAVIIVGCPDLTHMLNERLDSYLGTKGASQQSPLPKEWPTSVERLYVARDEQVARITGKTILILNGAIDPLVPSKFTQAWLAKYGANNDVMFVEQEATGHALSVQMVEKIVDWLPQFLV
ncbi:hypothetical protein SBRCBS47491_003923 [Sporothrix bragantina]|uniref:AB hydrolase-1 domain-containing protein n=1 Tax=Sporothrix bragantina TaxID=671064 RepID=A0ABP0BJ98_9PEZI